MKLKKIFVLFCATIAIALPLLAQDTLTEPSQLLVGHKEDIEALAFSPDGNFLVSTGWDNTIKVWDGYSGELLKDFKAHDGAVRCIAFSRDGKMLISGARDNSIKIWDSTWSTKFNLFGHQNTINSVIIDPALRFAYSGSADGMIKMWDLKKKGESKTFKKMPRAVNSLAINQRGTDIFIATEGPEIFNLTVQGKEKPNFIGHADEINALGCALNNKYIISGSSDKTAIIWNQLNGDIVHTLKGHTWKVTHVAFSNDSKFAITGSTDGTIKMWEVETGLLVKTFKGDVNSINAMAISPDLSKVASAAMVNSYLPEGSKFLVYFWETGYELDGVSKMRKKQYIQDSIRYMKDSSKIMQDSLRIQRDSLKKIEQQKKLDEQNKRLEEKQKKLEEQKKKKEGEKKPLEKGEAILNREIRI